MKEHLLKRALPFMLTFAVGAGVGGFFQFFTARAAGWLAAKRNTYSYASRRGCGKRFRRASAPESKPPVITFKPDAFVSMGVEDGPIRRQHARVVVTFGEDGKVREVTPRGAWSPVAAEALERAARQIQFIPATLDGAPTTVTEEVEIRLAP